MSKIKLELWQSLEVFSRIVCKIEAAKGEEITLDDFF